MILDTSAVVAVIFDEDKASELVDTILAAPSVKMSAATLVEVYAVLQRRVSPQDLRRFERLLRVWQVEVVPFDQVQAQAAISAYRDFGKGSGHPAQLNLGDCYTYGLAVTVEEQVLYVGDDFSHTDLAPPST